MNKADRENMFNDDNRDVMESEFKEKLVCFTPSRSNNPNFDGDRRFDHLHLELIGLCDPPAKELLDKLTYTNKLRALSIAKIFAEVHADDSDCLGKAARELLELVKGVPIATGFDCE